MKLLILLLIGLYSCSDDWDDKTGHPPFIIDKVEAWGSGPGEAYRYHIQSHRGTSYHNFNTYSDSLWSVGDTLKLVKQ